MDAEFFDSALNDRQADDASIGITPNCLAEEADRLRKQLLLASGDDLAVCHSPRPAVQHIRITPPLRGSRRSRAGLLANALSLSKGRRRCPEPAVPEPVEGSKALP